MHTFTYTAKNIGYASTVIIWMVLVGVEAGGVLLLVAALMSEGWLKLAIELLHTSLCIYVFITLFSALRVTKTAHTLDETSLTLRYGPLFKLKLPLSAITGVKSVQERVDSMQGMVARYEKDKKRLNVAFSDKGQVLLKLDRPYPFRRGLFRSGTTNQILLNVDKREEFLALLTALQAPEIPQKESAIAL